LDDEDIGGKVMEDRKFPHSCSIKTGCESIWKAKILHGP